MSSLKKCNSCKEDKLLDCFGKSKSQSDGCNKTCKDCRNKRNRELFLKDPERHRGYKKKYEVNNKAKIASYKKIYRKETREESKIKLQLWRKNNPDKVESYFHRHKHSTKISKAKRRALEEKANPEWLSEDQIAEMKSLYKMSESMSVFHETDYQVDHIEPLRGEQSCGLCVPWNLQILPRKENRLKTNKLFQPIIKDNKLWHPLQY